MCLKSEISIFIPSYNAADYLESVIVRIPQKLWQKIVAVWIINDGSEDNTIEVAVRLSQNEPKIRLYNFDCNKGYGEAVKKGLELCSVEECDIAVCLHADGQYPPEAIADFVEVMERENYDILQGSRIASGTALSGGMPFYKYIANRALTFFENKIFKLNMTDYHSGFLFYSRNALLKIPFKKLSHSFDFDLEVIACARQKGLKIGERPIPTRYAGEKSYLNPIEYGIRVLWVVAKYKLGRYRKLGFSV